MFKRFDPTTDISTSTKIKASLQRSIKSEISCSHPLLLHPSSNNITTDNDSEPISFIDELLPRKSPLIQYKIGPYTLLYCRSCLSSKSINIESKENCSNIKNMPSFFQTRNGPIL